MLLKIEIDNLSKSFKRGASVKSVLTDICLTINRGECVGIIGESGCGKTTLANCISGIVDFESGDVKFSVQNDGKILNYSLQQLSSKVKNVFLRSYLQYIFQNPEGSFHPKKKISTIFRESYRDVQRLTGNNCNVDIKPLLKMLNISELNLDKPSAYFSGGEKQRLTIARALMVKPSFLIADEPLSNMDVTTQAKIINFIKKLKSEGITIMLISHDLLSVRYLCDSIAIMRDGKIVEHQNTEDIFCRPVKDYTRRLIDLQRSIESHHNDC